MKDSSLKISNEELQISDYKWRNIEQFLNVLKTSNVEGHVSYSFYTNPSQTYAKSLSLGKCSSDCTLSELVYSRSNEQQLILLWSHGSAGHPLAAGFHCQQIDSKILKEKGTHVLGFIRISSRGSVACCASPQMSLWCLALSDVYFTKCLFPVLPLELGSFQMYVCLLQS